MTPSRFLARAGGTLGAALWLLAGTAPAAAAHPLGNFSVNHYLGLTVHPDRIEVLAVTDQAEIPTLQEQARVDRNADGTVDDAERGDWAAGQCTATATRLQVRAGPADTALNWRVRSASYAYADGAAGLRTARLECTLDAPLTVAADGTVLRVRSGADRARVGWNEITARGVGVRLDPTDVPEVSASHELRDYPQELLDAPSGVFDARFTATPGGGSAAADLLDTAPTGGPAGWLAQLDRRLAELGAAHRLTVTVGLLAVLLATVLGAGHALLPGHGKAAMGVYLATAQSGQGRRHGRGHRHRHPHGGRARARTAADRVLRAGGRGAARAARRAQRPAGDGGRGPAAARRTPPDQTRRPGDARSPAPPRSPPPAPARRHRRRTGGSRPSPPRPVRPSPPRRAARPDRPDRPGCRRGLVPSPSALVVLLGAVALGRTMFGVALVLAYGLGMAATLTAAGLLFLRVGKRIAAAADGTLPALLRRLAPWSGLLTALLVLTVGLGMVLRSLPAAL
ncbi:high frequency lysogenization protein HflD [Kitasatospora gansuensis]